MGNRYLLRRFFAFYIDAVINSIILHILLYVCNVDIIDTRIWHIMPVFIALNFCYFVISDFFFGRTLGKVLLRFSISGYNKQNKTKFFSQVAIRNFVRWIPFDQISIFFYEDNRMWHDIVSKTHVEDYIKN